MRITVPLSAVAIAAVLAVTATASAAPASVQLAVSADSLLRMAGCGSTVPVPAYRAREMARCDRSGGQLGAAVFGDQGERDAWLIGAPGAGQGQFVLGPTWVIVAESPNLARAIAPRVGGYVV